MIVEIYNRRTGLRCNKYVGKYRVLLSSSDKGLFHVLSTGDERFEHVSNNKTVATYSLNMFGFSEHVEG